MRLGEEVCYSSEVMVTVVADLTNWTVVPDVVSENWLLDGLFDCSLSPFHCFLTLLTARVSSKLVDSQKDLRSSVLDH